MYGGTKEYLEYGNFYVQEKKKSIGTQMHKNIKV